MHALVILWVEIRHAFQILDLKSKQITFMAPSDADKDLWLKELNNVVGTKIELRGTGTIPPTSTLASGYEKCSLIALAVRQQDQRVTVLLDPNQIEQAKQNRLRRSQESQQQYHRRAHEEEMKRLSRQQKEVLICHLGSLSYLEQELEQKLESQRNAMTHQVQQLETKYTEQKEQYVHKPE